MAILGKAQVSLLNVRNSDSRTFVSKHKLSTIDPNAWCPVQ